MASQKLHRKVPRVDGALTVPPHGAGCPASAQRAGVVNAVAASQRRRNQGHHLVAGVGLARGAAQVQVPVNQLGQAQVAG